MTPPDKRDQPTDAARLHAALGQPDPLTHAEAETLIALVVEAEAIGEDVDDDPTFAPLFRHLDHCAQCLALYEAVSEDYAATLAEQTSRAPQPLPFAPRVPDRVDRAFTFVVRAPRTSSYATLRESPAAYGTAVEQFADLAWRTTNGETTLTVRVLPPHDATAWRIELHTQGYAATAYTDRDGVVLFSGFPSDLPLTLSARERGR